MSTRQSGLLIIDVQNDFCPGGSLAVEHGDLVVPVLNAYSKRFQALQMPIYASRDWHPSVTKHFEEFGGLWPPHCIQGTPGADFHPDLILPDQENIVTTGDGSEDQGYSAFDGHFLDGTTLAGRLERDGVEHLYVGGLATDYCVRASALDARKTGIEVTLLLDAVRGVELNHGDSEKAIQEMRSAGINIATFDSIDLN